MSVCLCVCVSVCLCVCSLLRYRLNVFLPPLPEVGCPIVLEIRNPWGKVIKEVVSGLKIFVWKWSKIALQNMVETTLPDELETSGRRAYRKFWHISRRFWVFVFWMNFSVFQKNWVFGYSWSTLLWYRCYYPHRSRDALSPVCGIFYQGLSSLMCEMQTVRAS